MGKIYTRFQTKTVQNPHPFGGTYVSGSYKGVPLPPPPPHSRRLSCLVHFVNNANYATGWFAIWNLSNCECQYLSFVSNKIICLPSIKLTSNVISNKLKWTLKTCWAITSFQKAQLHSISIFFKLCPSVTQLYLMYYLYLHLMFKVVIYMFHSVWWHFLLFEVW